MEDVIFTDPERYIVVSRSEDKDEDGNYQQIVMSYHTNLTGGTILFTCSHFYQSSDHMYETNGYCVKSDGTVWVNLSDGYTYKWNVEVDDSIIKMMTSVYFPGLIFVGTSRGIYIYDSKLFEDDPVQVNVLT